MSNFVEQFCSLIALKISYPDFAFTVFLVARGSDFAW